MIFALNKRVFKSFMCVLTLFILYDKLSKLLSSLFYNEKLRYLISETLPVLNISDKRSSSVLLKSNNKAKFI